MFPAWIRPIFGKAFTSPDRKRTRRPAKFKPAVFPLEDRCVPATYNVVSTLDDATPGTLRQALTAASNVAGVFGPFTADAGADTIVFDAALGANPLITLTGGPTDATNGNNFFRITTDVTIDANAQTTLTIRRPDPGVSFRFFELDLAAARLVLNNVTLDQGKSSANGGGAIFMSNGTLNLNRGTRLTNNSALVVGDGGAVFVSGGTMTATGASFATNQAQNGGALAVAGGTVSLASSLAPTFLPSVVDGNTAPGDGGGINVTGGTLTVGQGVQITNNTSTNGDGGGINFAGGAGNHTIAGAGVNFAIIAANKALNMPLPVAGKGHGGGINLAAGFTGTVLIDEVLIGGNAPVNGNQAVFGGGLSILGGTLNVGPTVSGVVFNTATTTGGGIDIGASFGGTITSTALTVLDNSVTGVNSHGGGIAVHGGTLNLSVQDIGRNHADAAGSTGGGLFQDGGIVSLTGLNVGTFLNGGNTAESGAGIHLMLGTLSLLAGSVVAANTAALDGGGLLVSGGTANLTGATIGGAATTDGNRAGRNGGGIAYTGGTLNFTGAPSLIRFNHATGGSGGGLDISTNGNLDITNGTDFLDNDASTSGGGIAQRGNGTLTLTNVGDSLDILRNRANTNGGGLFLGGSGNTNINNLNCNSNFAAQNGGGILKDGGGVLTINVATLDLNRANTGDGGGLSVVGGIAGSAGVPISRVTFSNNFAANNGGGIAAAATANRLQLLNCTISGNTANNGASTGGGGGIFAATTTELLNVTVANNTAMGAAPATGGIRQSAASLTVQNTLVGDNVGQGPGVDINNSGGVVIDSGFNLFETSAGFATVGTDVLGQTPLLAPLANYGGPNSTMALLPGSPAIDAGTGVGPDQRGVAVFNLIKDIGAFESRGFTIVRTTPAPGSGFAPNDTQRAVINTNFTPNEVVTVTSNVPVPNAEPVQGGRVTFTAGVGTNGATATDTGGNPLSATPITIAADGTATVTARANQFMTNAGTFYTITATSRGAAPAAPPNAPVFNMENLGVKFVTFVATNQPTDTLSGQIISNAAGGVKVQLLDQNNNPIPLAGVPVTVVRTFVAADIDPAFPSPVLQSTPPVPINSDATGVATFPGLVLLTTGRYRLNATAPTNENPAGTTAAAVSNQFNIRASRLQLTNVVAKVRSGQNMSIDPAKQITVTAVGEDGSRDLFFNGNTPGVSTPISLTVTGPGTFFPAPPAPAGPLPPSPPPALPPNFGRAVFPSVALGRGSPTPADVYTLGATSTSLGQTITGTAPNTTLVTALNIRITQASAAGSNIPNTMTGATVMPPNSVRSSNQTKIVDNNKDILFVTISGGDVLSPNNLTVIDANLSLSVNSATRPGGIIIPTQAMDPVHGFILGGTTTIAESATQANTVQFDASQRLTLNSWGNYVIKADATLTAPPAEPANAVNTSALSNNVAVIARQLFIDNAPSLVVGGFTITTVARDVNNDTAENFDGPSDRAQVTVSNLAGGIGSISSVDGNGQSSAVMGNQIVAKKAPTKGVTVFQFAASRAIVSTVAIDELFYFLDSTGATTGLNAGTSQVNTLETGRRRPRPIPPVLIIPIAGTRVL